MPNEIFPAAEPRELISQAVEWLDKGHQLALLTLVNIEGNAPYPVGTQMLVNEQGDFHGQITGGCAETALAQQAVRAIKQRQNQLERYGLNSKYFDIQLPCGSGIDVLIDVQQSSQHLREIAAQLRQRKAYVDVIGAPELNFKKTYLPNERVLIFGQGPIREKLIQLAPQSGFEVVAFDHLKPVDLADYQDRYTALISLFHEHDFEIDIFYQALSLDLFYYGALGSHRTHQQRLAQLQARGVEKLSLKKISGPIGTDIGAISPAQIAISILSELIAVMNQEGRFAN